MPEDFEDITFEEFFDLCAKADYVRRLKTEDMKKAMEEVLGEIMEET